MYATRSAQETAQDAVQIFGGRGITRTGMGRFVEHVGGVYRMERSEYSRICPSSITERFPLTRYSEEVSLRTMVYMKCDAYREFVAEDVLGDLGVRQAIRGIPKNARL